MSWPRPTDRSVRSGTGQPAAATDSRRRSSNYTTTAIPDADLMQIARAQWGRLFPTLSNTTPSSSSSPPVQVTTSIPLETNPPSSIEVPSPPIPNATVIARKYAGRKKHVF